VEVMVTTTEAEAMVTTTVAAEIVGKNMKRLLAAFFMKFNLQKIIQLVIMKF
jgi:hypothetical protein